MDLVNALNTSLEIASENFHLDKFTYTLEDTSERGTITTQIEIGNHFGHGKYLIIQRDGPEYRMDVYQAVDEQFESVIQHKQPARTYLGDTIQDINGDGRQDFITYRLDTLGCCLQKRVAVYLQLTDGHFTEKIEFINPTFSIEERLVRGIVFGPPWQSELYKYEWHDVELDTLEYVRHWRSTEGHFIMSKFPANDRRSTLERPVAIDVIPDDYRSIEGFRTFMGDNQD